MYVYWSKWRKEWIDFKNQPPSKGELIQMEKLNYKTNNMKALERLYDKISNFLFGGKIMCRR